MPRFEVKQSAKLNLTSHSGLALIGQCCEAAQVDAVIDRRLPVSQGMKTSDMVKAMTGLLSLGKSDFDAIEPFRHDAFFKEALGMNKVASSAWMRQRLDAKASELRELTGELSVRLLGQLGLTGEIAPIRHPAKRRWLKTVLQEVMYRAAKFVAHARKLTLDFGRNFAGNVEVFVALQDRLLRAASP